MAAEFFIRINEHKAQITEHRHRAESTEERTERRWHISQSINHGAKIAGCTENKAQNTTQKVEST
jgi:hypothetical protein